MFCLLLIMPGLAIAGQDGGARPIELRSIAINSVSPRAVVAPRIIRERGAEADPALACEAAVTAAEVSGRLPPRLLHAISLTESGRLDPGTGVVHAWPWTINAEGEGHFFDSRDDAIGAVRALQARGVRSVDVGCAQVNLMYHPDAFASLEDAFDPRTNAAYAAKFLNALYAQGKDWMHAIAAYHSETPALGDAYRVLVLARWQNPDMRPVAQPRPAYRDFAAGHDAYQAFAPAANVYGAFATPDRR